MLARIYALMFAAVGWFAIVGQYVEGINADTGTAAHLLHYLSYFTILSNILVASTFTVAALAPDSGAGRLLLRPQVATATVLYITVTGIIYYLLLASLYQLTGWVLFFDRLLHYVQPPAFVLFWLLFVPKGTLSLRDVPAFLVFPLLYGAWTLIHGPFANWYPYPFIDVTKLGYPHVLMNIGGFVILFGLLGSLYVLLGRGIDRLESHTPAA
jgi:hypothetical protein